MGRRNRKRRRKAGGWSCLKCGAPMHRHLHGSSSRRCADLNRAGARQLSPLTHVCGSCEALHRSDDGVTLRLLTPAEEFRLRVAIPKTLAILPAVGQAGRATGADGTLILGTE